MNQASVNQRDARELPVPLPATVDEQSEIVAIVCSAQKRMDHLNDVISAQQQLKKSLMDDLLTGRVRVRDAATAVAS